MANLTMLLKIRKGIKNAMPVFQKQWLNFESYSDEWGLNKVKIVNVLEMI